MLERILFVLFLGTLSTCLGSPVFWYNILMHHTIWGDENQLGISKNIKLKTLIKSYLTSFGLTIFLTFLVCYFSSGIALFSWSTFTAIACIGLSHIWSSAFYTRLEYKNFLMFKMKLTIYFLVLFIYGLLLMLQ